jgi:hypothetical protein
MFIKKSNATFWLAAQCLNQMRYSVSPSTLRSEAKDILLKISTILKNYENLYPRKQQQTSSPCIEKLQLWPDHDQQRCYHHVPTVKPEVVNAVISS